MKLLPDHIQQIVKHPSEEILGFFFTTYDTGNLVSLKGMISSVKYIEILCSRIVQFMITFDGTFQQDLALRHNSISVQIFVQGNKMKVLVCPGNSLDLNPIKNLWRILKNLLAKMNGTTTE
ncbi:hypothetical protein TNIN_268191 [Trichonephila inaurata madagascariensis]|uniref:Tc1-like transposase DDE domain-containing protein n=1 Tax=Trichonephila inaurata madagascariensis TaxID=2747483 RepID=A0A8X7CLJ7_9ARAC|nr:hypothetical protein TNIN_268191 [Trichonephila inaurata madagascariensis]